VSHNDLQPRSRAVSDAPIDALLGGVEELARRWAISLIVSRALEDIGEIPLEDLARDAPAVCALAVRALGSNADLRRLEEHDATARLGAIAGARDAASAVGAVESLRAVLWEALLDELRWPSPDQPILEEPSSSRSLAAQIAELSDRLAYVCSRILARVVAVDPRVAAEQSAGAFEPPVREAERLEPEPDRLEREPGAPAAPGSARVTLDESPQIEIRDTRGEEGPAAWIGSIGRRLERYEEDRLPFAVLLVEVADIDRLAHAEAPSVITQMIAQVESALSDELRPADQLTRETRGRYWLVTPETDEIGARMLAERLARTVRLSASHRGTPLEIAIGIAVCPEDGRESAALAAYADMGVYAARAAGRPIAPQDEPA
jgi:GGDEF domain-containing protein